MRINREAAANAFDRALDLAAGSEPLPEPWNARFRLFARERTYSAVLATALLARSVEPRADAFVLQARAGKDGFSARGLFTAVIFERANLRGLSLGSIGREPHNNQPFYGHSRVQDIDRRRLHRFSLPRFDQLVVSLEAANQLGSDEAMRAFATFLRVRLQEPAVKTLPLALPLLDAMAVIAEMRELVGRGGESGRRAEAVVAAALDLAFPNVHMNRKANDPSRHWPGDVVVLTPGSTIRSKASRDVVMSAEVKERSATEGEIMQFASNIAGAGIQRGLYAAMASTQSELAPEQLQQEIWKRHKVFVTVVVGTDSLVRWTLTLTRLQLPEALTNLAVRVAERLREKQSVSGRDEWNAFLLGLGASAGAVIPLLGSPPRTQS